MKSQDAKDEYAKTVELIKHYATIQFAQLSLFLAIMGAVVAFFLGDNVPAEPIPVVYKFGMVIIIIIVLCFCAMQESHMFILSYFLGRAAELEREIGYQVFSKLPGMPYYKYPPAKLALRAIYLFIFIFWVVTAFAVFC